MYFRQIFVVFCVAILALGSNVSAEEKVRLDVDTKASELEWLGKKVTGQHNGTVNFTSGHIVMRDSVITNGEFELAMNTISNEDVESPKWRKKLEDHLKSDDFFNVSQFPKGTFKITGSEGSLDKEVNEVKIIGELTIKGITVPVEMPATIKKEGDQYVGTGKVAIDRTKWDIRYNSGKFFDPGNLGDKLIYDDIGIEVKIVAAKAAA